MGSDGKTSSNISEIVRFPYGGLLLISSLFFILYVISVYSGISDNFEAWFSRLTAATFGSYLTAIVVDRSFRRREQKELERIENSALRELKEPINGHLKVLCTWYTSSLGQRPEKIPSTWEELFEGEFEDQVVYLDFSGDSPTTNDDVDMMMYSAHKFKEFSESIDLVLWKYSHGMESDLVEKLESLSNSELIDSVVHVQDSRKEFRRLDGKDREKALIQFYSTSIHNSAGEHLDDLTYILNKYDEVDNINIAEFEGTSIHRDDVDPEIGNAKLNEKVAEMLLEKRSEDNES